MCAEPGSSWTKFSGVVEKVSEPRTFSGHRIVALIFRQNPKLGVSGDAMVLAEKKYYRTTRISFANKNSEDAQPDFLIQAARDTCLTRAFADRVVRAARVVIWFLF